MSLVPSSYDYIHFPDAKSKSIGFMGQELNKDFPELVLSEPDDTGETTYMVNYAGMSVVAIKAIQEQQAVIADQQEKILNLEVRLDELMVMVLNIEKRLDHRN